MREVLIAGAAMTRFGKFLETPLRVLAQAAVRDALADAHMPAGDVGLVVFGNAAQGLVDGQESIRGQVALRDTGLAGAPLVNVENACASSSTATQLAALAVAAGQCEVALAIGAEKLYHVDKARSFAAFEGAIDRERRAEVEQRIYGDGPRGNGTLFMDIYADLTCRYMERSGATERDFAEVAVKAHRHGALNEKAQYRNELTLDEVLAARRIAGPLTLPMCSPIGDGAAALVLCSREHARRAGAIGDGPVVQIAGMGLVSGSEDPAAEASVTRAAARAYEQAGLGPGDVDVIELHDAAAPAELIVYEELGLCEPGEGPALLASGATALGGRLPVNPSGGLLSKGHPVGATGCAQLVELCDQLRGRAGARQVEDARVALAENAGGFLTHESAAATVTLLERV